ncbi:MAG: hypothetical protein NTZ33_11205 [Bacteroidetes bacterium]|nr:hypothetical protein [Bacteroidota bacterium]
MKIQLLNLLFLICIFSYQADKNKGKALLNNNIENGSNVKSRNTTYQNLKFKPDTSINGISLMNPRSIHNSFGNLMQYIDNDKDIPYVLILSIDKKQYLKLSFHPGSIKNEFSYFEIGILKDKLLNKKNNVVSKYKTFITENNIKIGISKNVFFKYRNKQFLKTKNKNLYTYEIDNFMSSAFLKAYNMPSYSAKYRFNNDTLVQFEFGFDYP